MLFMATNRGDTAARPRAGRQRSPIRTTDRASTPRGSWWSWSNPGALLTSILLLVLPFIVAAIALAASLDYNGPSHEVCQSGIFLVLAVRAIGKRRTRPTP
jgi:hypothetical protein